MLRLFPDLPKIDSSMPALLAVAAPIESAEVRIVAADTLGGERVVDREGNDVGCIDDLVIDVPRGRIAYAVMTPSGPRGPRVAVPWSSLCRDDERGCFVLEVAGTRS
jgi:hypothetical protein